jgi:hypothetical protein
MSRSEKRGPEQLLQIIDAVYEAALDESSWTGLAPRTARTFGSTSTNLQIQQPGAASQILSMTDNVRSGVDAYLSHYWQRDVWVERHSVGGPLEGRRQ